jgi:hypothetical protein
LSQQKSFSAQERRAACVALLLQWRGVPLNSGGRERVDLQAQDQVCPKIMGASFFCDVSMVLCYSYWYWSVGLMVLV